MKSRMALALILPVMVAAAGASALAQGGPTSWSQSIMHAPASTPANGDLVPFVRNGKTYQCTFGTSGCFTGGGGGGGTLGAYGGGSVGAYGGGSIGVY